ncbi:MAG: ATP-dependent RecD-like DNA helicase [Clostridia bacterium]|nr:ATP-dependent RecD-like DNA helicase [Clostridia bacterium]
MNQETGNEKELLSIEGSIEKIIYQNEENGYTVCELLAPSEELFVLVGTMPYLCEGETIAALGDWTTHPTFGTQFKVEYYEKKLPATANLILKYLSSGAIKGIGPSTAKKIVAQYGDDTLEVLENHPEWLADISGISPRKAKEIGETFRTQFGMRSVMLFCSNYFSPTTAMKIFRKWGIGAVDVIKENPYMLCSNIPGIGFDKADMVARDLGMRENCAERIAAGLSFVLSYNMNQNGHVYLPQEKLIPAAMKLLSCSQEEAEDELEQQISFGKLRSVKIGGRSCIYLREAFEAERYICTKLDMLEMTDHLSDTDSLNFLIEKTEMENGIRYEGLQKKAIMEAVRNAVFVLTGGPGTGKTTVVRAILRIFESMGLNIALATPTGRAAKRLSEASGREAKTIHRMLEMDYRADEGPVFRRDESSLLDEDVIIVDEASMIDLYLMEALLRAMRPGTRLILIGDANQLPPVGAGSIFKDIILGERFSMVELTHIFRQARESLIVTNAHTVNRGEHIDLSKKDGDFFFLPSESDEQTASIIRTLCKTRLPRAYGVSVYDGIQVITPSRKGQNGTEMLNSVLQSAINPSEYGKKEKAFRDMTYREGDKVMQTRNNYDIAWQKNGAEGFGIYNGDIGIIRKIDVIAQSMTIDFDGRMANYDFSMTEELELAYAITVHKSQGSEYPIVVIPLYRYTPKLLTRNLFYTAITRAQQMVILVGNGEVAQMMTDNNRQTKRYTGLAYFMTQYE